MNATREENLAEIVNDSHAYAAIPVLIAIYAFLTGEFATDAFNYTALKQTTRMRIRFFQTLIRQEIAWYDTTDDTNFAVRITE